MSTLRSIRGFQAQAQEDEDKGDDAQKRRQHGKEGGGRDSLPLEVDLYTLA